MKKKFVFFAFFLKARIADYGLSLGKKNINTHQKYENGFLLHTSQLNFMQNVEKTVKLKLEGNLYLFFRRKKRSIAYYGLSLIFLH